MSSLKDRIHDYLTSFDEVDLISIMNLLNDYFKERKDKWTGIDYHETLYSEDGSEYYYDASILYDEAIASTIPKSLLDEAKLKANQVAIHAKEAIECAEKALDCLFSMKINDACMYALEAYQIESQYHRDFAPVWGDFCLILRKLCIERGKSKV